jgi:hypothetical protein
MLYMSNQSDFILSENLRLRLENHRLKKKLKKLECVLHGKNWAVKKVFNKYFYKFFFLKFISLARNWNKMYKNIVLNEFNLLFNLNKKNLSQVTLILTRYIDLLKFFSTLIIKFSELFILSQNRFNYIKIFFDQILTLKLHKLFNNQNFKKVPYFKRIFFNNQSEKINSIKKKLEKILNTSFFTNPKKLIKFIIIEKIYEHTVTICYNKKSNQPRTLFFQLEIIKHKLSNWTNLFLSKLAYQKKILTDIFKKITNLNLITKKFFEKCFVHLQQIFLKTGIIYKKFSKIFCKIRILRKKLRIIKKIKLNIEKEKKLRFNKKFKKFPEVVNLFKYNKQLIFFKPTCKFKIIKEMFFFEKYINNLNTNKKEFFKSNLNKNEFFNKLLKNIILKPKIYGFEKFCIEYNSFLFNNIPFIHIQISFYRISDIDKEINTLWCILKRFSDFIFFHSKISILHLKCQYFKLQDLYFKIKNEFNKIVLNLKQKIFIFQKNNSISKEILIRKKKKKYEIENKLYEIKGMEADFSDILKQIKK